MTAQVFPFRPGIRTDLHFGACPHCGKTDGYLNIGPDHWFVCDKHRTSWFAGSNLFPGWEDDTPAIALNRAKVASYRVVQPIYPDASTAGGATWA
jgi:hypothetical protein